MRQLRREMEAGINELPGVNKASISFMTSKLMIDADAADAEPCRHRRRRQAVCTSYEKTAASSVKIPHEPEAEKTPHPHHRRARAVRRH
ncbi:MAG: hypothetical protein ACLUW6_07470 [Coriobacteriaceae bacterium]